MVDREGRAVAGAEILLDLRAFLTGREVPAAAAVTGEDGRFAIPDRRAGERIDVMARKSGYGIASVGGVVVPPEIPLRLELPPLARISGRVLDARGQPAEASVSGDLLYRVQTGAMGAMMGSNSIEAVATDAEGRFELGDLAAGEVELVARGSGGELAVRRGLELAPGEVLEGVELRFEPGARLVGRVTDPDGRPVRDAFVEVNGAPGPALAGARAVTDGDGHFRMPGVAPGRYSVVAQKHPFRRGVREIEIGAADSEVQVELQLGAGLAVRGSVVDDQGAAAAECWLTLSKAGVNVGNRIGDLSRSDGTFEIAGVEPGSYRLVAEKAGFRRAGGARAAGGRGARCRGPPAPAGARRGDRGSRRRPRLRRPRRGADHRARRGRLLRRRARLRRRLPARGARPRRLVGGRRSAEHRPPRAGPGDASPIPRATSSSTSSSAEDSCFRGRCSGMANRSPAAG